MKTELKNIGAWGRLHYDFLYRNQRSVINAMRLKGTLHDYLMGIDKDAEKIEKLADTVMKLQSKENTVLPLLKKRFADTQKSIDNMLDAIQQGILTASTKERLESLEKQKSELSVQIIKEEMEKPTLSREQIIFWFHRFRKLNTKRLDHRRRLIDSFVNAIFLYDDRITFTFNYKDGSKTITFAELEKSGLGSDINALAAPNKKEAVRLLFLFGAEDSRSANLFLNQ